MGPKNHRYAHFAEFGGLMNSVMGPQKKPNALKHAFSAIQIHTKSLWKQFI